MNLDSYYTYFATDRENAKKIINVFNGNQAPIFTPTPGGVYVANCFNAYWIGVTGYKNFVFGFYCVPIWYQKWIDIINGLFEGITVNVLESEVKPFSQISYGSRPNETESRKKKLVASIVIEVVYDKYYSAKEKYFFSYTIHHMVRMISLIESWYNDVPNEPDDILDYIIKLNNDSRDTTRKLCEEPLDKTFFTPTTKEQMREIGELFFNPRQSYFKQTDFMVALYLVKNHLELTKLAINYAESKSNHCNIENTFKGLYRISGRLGDKLGLVFHKDIESHGVILKGGVVATLPRNPNPRMVIDFLEKIDYKKDTVINAKEKLLHKNRFIVIYYFGTFSTVKKNCLIKNKYPTGMAIHKKEFFDISSKLRPISLDEVDFKNSTDAGLVSLRSWVSVYSYDNIESVYLFNTSSDAIGITVNERKFHGFDTATKLLKEIINIVNEIKNQK